MALPRFIEIDGRRYLWRDLVALRRAQATPPNRSRRCLSFVTISARPPPSFRPAQLHRERS